MYDEIDVIDRQETEEVPTLNSNVFGRKTRGLMKKSIAVLSRIISSMSHASTSPLRNYVNEMRKNMKLKSGFALVVPGRRMYII